MYIQSCNFTCINISLLCFCIYACLTSGHHLKRYSLHSLDSLASVPLRVSRSIENDTIINHIHINIRTAWLYIPLHTIHLTTHYLNKISKIEKSNYAIYWQSFQHNISIWFTKWKQIFWQSAVLWSCTPITQLCKQRNSNFTKSVS